jgi:hypothetical protein
VSQCQNCGTICEAFPITDISSAQLYSGKECTIITGDLYIQDLPTSVTKKLLFDSLQTVRYVRGDLYFLDNPFISAMTFFSNLVGERRASATDIVHIEDADIPIEDEFYTMAPQVYLDSRQRIVAPILNRWRSNSALREMFVHLMETATMGISKKSDLTNTFQTSFGRNKTIDRLFEK